MLPKFLRPEALEILVEEVNGCIGDAWFCNGTHNVHLVQADPGVPVGDVAGRQERTFVGSVPYDRLGGRLLAPAPLSVGPAEGLRRCGAGQAPASSLRGSPGGLPL